MWKEYLTALRSIKYWTIHRNNIISKPIYHPDLYMWKGQNQRKHLRKAVSKRMIE